MPATHHHRPKKRQLNEVSAEMRAALALPTAKRARKKNKYERGTSQFEEGRLRASIKWKEVKSR